MTQLAWPMILSNLTVPLLGLVDTAILGHLPHPYYLGAVAIGAIIFDMLFWSFAFLRMGTTALSAQAYGADDHTESRRILYKSLLMALFIGTGLILLRNPILDLAFWYMGPEVAVAEHARIYADIRIFSAPAVLCDYVIAGWLLSLGKTRQVLWIALATNLTNLVLDYWLVVEQGLFTDGVAWGSFVASLVALTLGLRFVVLNLRDHPSRVSLNELNSLSAYLPLLSMNRYLFVRTLCLLFSFTFFYAQSAQQDTITLGANSVLMTLILLFAYGADGFANAAEVLAGRTIGARIADQFHAVTRAASLWFFISALAFVLILAVFEAQIINLLTDIPSVVAATHQHWPWLMLVPLIATWNFMFDGLFLGAGKARAMQNTMLCSSLCVFFPAWYLFLPLANHGLWLAFCFFHLARSGSMALVYRYYSQHHLWVTKPRGSQHD